MKPYAPPLSFEAKALLLLGSLQVMGMVVLGALAYQQSQQVLRHLAEERFRLQAEHVSQQVADYVRDEAAILLMLAQMPPIPSTEAARFHETWGEQFEERLSSMAGMRLQCQLVPSFAGGRATLADSEGRLFYHSQQQPPYGGSTLDAFHPLLARHLRAGDSSSLYATCELEGHAGEEGHPCMHSYGRAFYCGEDALEFIVRDSGEGIAPEAMERISELYEQAGDPDARKMGTGIGLAIARHIAAAHGGGIRAHSPGVGMGSTLAFSISRWGGPEDARVQLAAQES